MPENETEAALRAANEELIESWRDYFDLSVPLTIELGRTRLSVRQVLDLELHGIVQLSRSSGEGVDVLADNRPLARGEIIMIEDRAGVRVNQIIAEED